MRAKSMPIVLQVVGLLVVVGALARTAFAATICKTGVEWDSTASDEYVYVNADGTPACTHACDPNTCESYAHSGGAYSCRCAGTGTSSSDCELRVTYTGAPYACSGSLTCRKVDVSCVDVSCAGTCPPWSHSAGSCWDSGTAHVGLARCPNCP